MSAPRFDAARACALAILGGRVLQTAGVSAGRGLVVDWRTVKSGEALLEDGDAFDVAYLFVALVGADVAAALLEGEVEPAAPVAEPPPRVVAFMPNQYGARRRRFDVGPFSVLVEPHDDDAAQADFAAKLAAAAAALVPQK